MMADLKPCPMCGGTADLKRFHIRCTHCRLRTDDYTHNVDAIAAWNRRAEPITERQALTDIRDITGDTHRERPYSALSQIDQIARKGLHGP